jgi:SulP family sulfate permease
MRSKLPQFFQTYLQRFGTRKTLGSDVKAGVALGVASVPDGLASAVLAGVNPLFGLNAYLVGTIVGAVSTGSVFMTVQGTGAMAVLIQDVPEVHGDNGAGAMTMLAILTGLVMLGLGIARLGSLVRFIPSAVLFGFVNAVAVNIVLGQLANFTGYASDGPNRIVRAFDTLISFMQFHWPTFLVGVVTVALILLLERTRLGALSLVVAVVIGSAITVWLPGVKTIGDISSDTIGLPSLSAPDFSSTFALLIPAVSLALVGLVQGAAISGSIPNPDGRYPDPSSDFRGQGLANIAAGALQGMPVGGSMSATALVRTAGAKTALANLIAGIVMFITIVAFGSAITFIAMPALAALLITVGVRTFKIHQVLLVWRTGPTQAFVFALTFLLTLLIPLQYAVLSGVALSVVLHIARQSQRVRVVQWRFDDPDGQPEELPAPTTFAAGETVVLSTYGSLFFASAQSFRDQLPAPSGATPGAHVVIRVRGTDELGVTFLGVLNDYASEISEHDATLVLAGVGTRLAEQLDATGISAQLGKQNIFMEQRRVGASLAAALRDIAQR